MKKIIQNIRTHAFLTIIMMIYVVLLIIQPRMGLQSIQNSGYYIKEMLTIMPVIFVLTALLDTWVPKEIIMQYLGKGAKLKGIVCSFLLGSISAGPIYAAFPICTMLYSKGASIRNIVIILSSWAVIKIPMLLNEAKFLGVDFMVIRWVLTVAATVIFSWGVGKIVKDDDMPQTKEVVQEGIAINQNACMGCTLCVKKYPEYFEMQGRKAVVKKQHGYDEVLLQTVINACPVKAIGCSETIEFYR